MPPGGFIVALRDTNRDGRADVIRRFGQTSEDGGRGGTGIAVYKDAIYAEAGPAILRYRLTPGELVPQATPDTIVAGLRIEGSHPMHPFAIDSNGNLLVNSGSKSNSCQVKDRELESPGRRPCDDLTTSAGIWRFDANRTKQRFSPAARYATGIRNAGGLAVTADGQFYVTQHGRDQLAANWPKLYDWKQSAELPAEELIRVERGGDYGWPYCYYDRNLKTLVLAPEYGGDGKKVGECAKKGQPAAAYPGALGAQRPGLRQGRGLHRIPRLLEPFARAAGWVQGRVSAVRGREADGRIPDHRGRFRGGAKGAGSRCAPTRRHRGGPRWRAVHHR